ncbi:MAG TPA: glycerophosphodiester phosphodiesterase family protein [Terriglobia bacterium]|jgi:glycerophosphoryl diester phosphodiesterase|nr:glycerophosphodiester phosphodiesterase family protein [Terriglobia bacterium]
MTTAVIRPLVLGHRGASAEAPENTLAAFDLALRQGADGIEFDVRLSADGVPVVIHDARLERTTSGKGRVDERDARELGRLDAGDRFNRRHPVRARAKYAGLRIPLLSETLDWVKERGCLAYVELKRERSSNTGLEEKVLSAIESAGVARQVVIISFHPAVLERVRRQDSSVTLGLDCTRPLAAIRKAQAAGASVVLPLAALVSRYFIERAHARGLQVVPWGAETPRAWRRLLASGVDGLITNRPAALRRLAESATVAPRHAEVVESR